MRRTIAERWIEYHLNNPHVYKEFERRAFGLLDAGETRIGVALLREAMRYDRSIRTLSWDFKIPNDYTPYYARLLILKNPVFEDVIVLRQWRGDESVVYRGLEFVEAGL